MDSRENSTTFRNTSQLNIEGENYTPYTTKRKQLRLDDDTVNIFASMSNTVESSSDSLNGPLPSSSVTSNERGHRNGLSNVQSGASQVCNIVSDAASQMEVADNGSVADLHVCDNGVESNEEVHTCQRHKNCIGKVGNSNHNLSMPSTSGTSKTCDNVSENSSFKESRKRASTLKIKNIDVDDSSSDTGNDDYSLGSEDGCVYTYRGGEHLADLPSSFFSLDMGLPLDKHLAVLPNYQVPQSASANVRLPCSRASSPDMDFLEMDFDPGPSCEVDSGDESTPTAEIEDDTNMPEENEPVFRVSPEPVEEAICNLPPVLQVDTSPQTQKQDDLNYYSMPSTSRGINTLVQSNGPEVLQAGDTYGPYITHVNVKGEELLVRRTMSQSTPHSFVSLHASNGDLISTTDILNFEDHQDNLCAHQSNQSKKVKFDSALSVNKTTQTNKPEDTITTAVENNVSGMEFDASQGLDMSVKPELTPVCAEVPQSMVWTEGEARERQVSQIATSACGATAVINVFTALGVPVNIEKINSAVGTRQRANNAPLPRYLLSRAVAGCTAADLVTGVQRASDGLVTARFFPTYPEPAVSLSHWLADWITLGAVPILTLNLQVGNQGEIADAWHHQMVFGVSPSGVFLCNPIECVRDTVLWPRLTSPSVLLVRTSDIIARFTPDTDLTPLMYVPDRRFHTFNVLGQVVSVIREWRINSGNNEGRAVRSGHVRVPAAYSAGVTVAALTGSEAHRRLVHAPHLTPHPSRHPPPP